MPPHYQVQQEAGRYDGRLFRNLAKSIGEDTYFFIDALLKEREVRETVYHSCMGILQFLKKDGNMRLECVCHRAQGTHLLFEMAREVTPEHENLKGRKAFA